MQMRQNTKAIKCKCDKMGQMGQNVNVSKFNCDKLQIQTIENNQNAKVTKCK